LCDSDSSCKLLPISSLYCRYFYYFIKRTSGLISFQFKPTDQNVGITPDLPNEFFKSQQVFNSLDPGTVPLRVSRTMTHAYPVSGADLCNGTNIVALEYCLGAKSGQVEGGNRLTHFSFFTIQELGPGTFNTSCCFTPNIRFSKTNCSGEADSTNRVCCIYYKLPSSPAQSNVKYVGLANLNRNPFFNKIAKQL